MAQGSKTIEFLTCFAGLQISYLTWGFCQESLMTTQFNPTPLVPKGTFPSASFAVFSNRVIAIIVAYFAVRAKVRGGRGAKAGRRAGAKRQHWSEATTGTRYSLSSRE